MIALNDSAWSNWVWRLGAIITLLWASPTLAMFCPLGGSCGTTPCSQFSDCTAEPVGCKICAPGFLECGPCTVYGSDQTNCLNDTGNNGGICVWDGSCCQDSAASGAPELPQGAFWYFAVGVTILVLGLIQLLPQRGSSA